MRLVDLDKLKEVIENMYLDGESAAHHLENQEGDTLIGKFQVLDAIDDLSRDIKDIKFKILPCDDPVLLNRLKVYIDDAINEKYDAVITKLEIQLLDKCPFTIDINIDILKQQIENYCDFTDRYLTQEENNC